MEALWQFVRGQEAQGPVTGDGLIQLALQGILGNDTLVWTPGRESWTTFSSQEVLMKALREAEEREPAAKRQRCSDVGSIPSFDSALQDEIPAWVETLDEPSTLDLFEKALFTMLEDVIRGRPALRDELLTAYVKRHPVSEDSDPSAYSFTDAFLVDAVGDFESREEMWEVLGKDNESTVRGVISVAARLDRHYCGQLQAMALLSRARQLLQAATDGGTSGGPVAVAGGSVEDGGYQAGQAQREALLQLMREHEELAIARDMDGRSLWHDLVAGQHLELLRMLVPVAASAGFAAAPAADKGDAGQQSVIDRVQERQEKPASTASKQPNCLNLPDAGGNTPLHLAADSAQLEAARLLIDSGASLDMQNRDPSRYASGEWSVRSRDVDFAIPVPSLHQTPLHIVAEAGDLDMMRLLVAQGALLDLRDSSGSTPLHLALEAQDERAVELLLNAGANPTLGSPDMGEGGSCVHAAAAAGKPSLLRLLLATGRFAGDSINRRSEQGWTALHLAARRGSKECVQLLLEHGADHSVVTEQGKTPLQIAQINKRDAVVAALLADGQEGAEVAC